MSDATPETPPADAPAGHPGHGSAARWAFPIAVVIALVAVFWPSSDERLNLEAFRRVGKGQAAPVGMLIDSSGRPIPFGTRIRPVTLVHFWATWCPPCITEIPSILSLADDYAGDHNFSLVMIAVADDIEKAGTFLGNRLTDALFDHDWKLTHSYGTKKVPETHLVINGKVVESFIGATNWSQPDIRQRLDDALVEAQGSEG